MKAEIELEEALENIFAIGRGFGLDPFKVNFTLVPPHIMYEFGAYGLPGRFSHWTHGRAYHQMKTFYDYGLSKIYEMVINTDPTQAFLLEQNQPIQNKLVAAHILAHSDFFRHNVSFSKSNRQMLESASLNADRIRQYEFEHGKLNVEKFLDSALSIEINIDSFDFAKPDADEYISQNRKIFEDQKRESKRVKSPFDDLFALDTKDQLLKEKAKIPFPIKEEADLLYFIASFSKNLEDWQRDIIEIVRFESYYFHPQRMTKVMNEGWASFWHAKILRELGERDLLSAAEYSDFAKLHSAVLAPHLRFLNPYHIGLNIWEDIDRRGKGLKHPEDKIEKDWLGQPVKVETHIDDVSYDLFWARQNIPSDQAFFRNYLTDYLIHKLDLFLFKLDAGEWKITDKDPSRVKKNLLTDMDNFGYPLIKVEIGGGDYKGNGELYLKHHFNGYQLDIERAKKTLPHIYSLWGRPVHLETVFENQPFLISSDGSTDIQSKKL